MPLLSAWIALVLTVVTVSALAFACFRLYARRVGDDGDFYNVRRALLPGLAVTAIVAFVAVLGTGLDAATSATLGSVGVESESATVALDLAIAGLGVLTATTAGYLGALPAVLRLRSLDVSPPVAARRFVRWTAAVVAPLLAVLFVVGRLEPRTDGALVGAAGVVVVLVYAAGPRLVRIGSSTRELSPEERYLVEDCCADLGFSPRRLYVLETGANRWPGVLVRGPPGRRTLFVTDRLLDAYDRAEVRAVIAANTGRARRLYTEYRLAVAIVLVLASHWAVTTAPNAALALGAVAAVGVVLLWIGCRIVYAADDGAAAAVDRDTVIEAYRRVAADADVESGGRITAFARMRPSMAERIGRLASDRTT